MHHGQRCDLLPPHIDLPGVLQTSQCTRSKFFLLVRHMRVIGVSHFFSTLRIITSGLVPWNICKEERIFNPFGLIWPKLFIPKLQVRINICNNSKLLRKVFSGKQYKVPFFVQLTSLEPFVNFHCPLSNVVLYPCTFI